jgi:hypothetical protein
MTTGPHGAAAAGASRAGPGRWPARTGRACPSPWPIPARPWAIAVARDGAPVGIDVERQAAGCVCALVPAMHADHAALVQQLPEPERHAAQVASTWTEVVTDDPWAGWWGRN